MRTYLGVLTNAVRLGAGIAWRQLLSESSMKDGMSGGVKSGSTTREAR